VHCPHCDAETISFTEWSIGLNAFRWRCPHCEARLGATTRVKLFAAVFFVAGLAVGGYAVWEYASESVSKGELRLNLLIGLAVLLMIGLPVGRVIFGGGPYRVVEQPPETPDTPE